MWSLTHPQNEKRKKSQENLSTSSDKDLEKQQGWKEDAKEIFTNLTIANPNFSKTNIRKWCQHISEKKKNHKKKGIHKSKKSNHGHKREKYVWKTIHY